MFVKQVQEGQQEILQLNRDLATASSVVKQSTFDFKVKLYNYYLSKNMALET